MKAFAFCLASLIALIFGQPLLAESKEIRQSNLRAPSHFPDLPADLQKELVRRGCHVPTDLPVSSNVVLGQFEKVGQFDWAVLCSSRNVTKLLVFWNGLPENPTELFHESTSDNYGSYIRSVDKDFIQEHYKVYGGPKPPATIDHNGIEAGGEKASIVFYRFRRKWLHLQGAD